MRYFYKIGQHVILASDTCNNGSIFSNVQQEYTKLEFNDGVALRVIRDGDMFAALKEE